MNDQPVNNCGLCGIYPKWMQKCATPYIFMLTYGFLGLVQSMGFIYIVATLTTLEKQFKMPSQTTGVILSGNEISEILSLLVMYYGGAGHRPRWLAAGIGISALSCFMLVIPHLIYGPGEAALALTQEHLDRQLFENVTTSTNYLSLCPGTNELENCDDTSEGTVVPKIFIFLSQLVFGLGTTLYYGLGQTYLDDNAKKTSTPMLLGISFGLRNTGPALGFILGFFCLKLYIVPTLHPVINNKDPRWLGAWWLGWIILGSVLSIFAVLMAMFPRDLPKTQESKKKKSIIIGTRLGSPDGNESPAEISTFMQTSQSEIGKQLDEELIVPTLGDFVITLKRVLTNRLLLCNNLSLVFSVLGSLPHITFIAKYLEVQFNTSTAGGTVVTGPVALFGMVLGFITSGFFISKVQPRPSRLLSWNVLCGLSCIVIQTIYIFNSCPATSVEGIDPITMQVNFTKSCNVGCNCENVKYSPVCHRASMTAYFSACHAGCTKTIDSQILGNCNCILNYTDLSSHQSSLSLSASTVNLGPCANDCSNAYTIFGILILISQFLVATGRIGNILVNFRCVKKRDKSVAQGVTLTFVSLFALMLAPIVYGAVIDQTCLIWENTCGSNGNCWYYDKHQFRRMFNSMAVGFTFVGVSVDIIVCYLGRNLDLYGAEEMEDQAGLK